MAQLIYKRARPRRSTVAIAKARVSFLSVREKKEKELAAQARIRTQLLKGRLIDKEEFFAMLAPAFIGLRYSFEKLLGMGVPESVVNEMLAILERAQNIQSNGKRRNLGAVGPTRAAKKATRPD